MEQEGMILNQNQFEAVTRALAFIPSRRDVLRGLAGAGLALGTLEVATNTDAKKRRKNKKDKKPKPNAYGCLSVGKACKSADQCCAGICEGKMYRAHDTGTCDQQGPEICSINPPLALTCNNNAACRCYRSTAGSIACVQYLPGVCADCQRDADCAALGYPPGSVCAPFSVGACAGECESGMNCLIPCGVEFPTPEPV